MANKLFKVVGISTFKGKRKVRYAQSIKRIIALDKCGNTDIEMFELPEPMTKADALAYALNNKLFTINNLTYDKVVDNIRNRTTVDDVLQAVA